MGRLIPHRRNGQLYKVYWETNLFGFPIIIRIPKWIYRWCGRRRR